MKPVKFLFLIITIALASCAKETIDKSDDLFFVRNKGADMPVWVRGNTESGTYIILNHGGPGSSGIFEVHMEAAPGNGQIDHDSPLKILEEEYTMVYWDQRHSGNSQGNANPDETTMEDFGDDLELVINTLKQRYDVKKLIVIGQSWGHSVATIYMTYGDNWQDRQSTIDGYIGYKGNIAFSHAYQYARPRLQVITQENINSSEDLEYWQEAQSFLNEHDRLETPEDAMSFFEIADHTMDAVGSTGQRIGTSLKYSLSSPHNGWFHWSNNNATFSSKFLANLVTDDRLIETAPRINVPTLMVYGRNDLIAPFEVGEWHMNNIASTPNTKELLILEESRHGAEKGDIEIFQNEIIDFVNKI